MKIWFCILGHNSKGSIIHNENETNYYLAESLFKLNDNNSAKEAYFVLAIV